ncbi:MAG: polysaccharide deacetylase family protein [Candidatus Kariarchaeaceae archaeon]
MFNTVSRKQFITQMEYIIGSGRYDLLSLEEYINNLSKPNAINPITITFDDGYESLLSDVLPLAKSRKIPFSVFISTGYIGKHNKWDTLKGDLRINILNWNNLVDISAEKLVTVGSHGVNHLSHGSLDSDEDLYEIRESKYALEKRLNRKVKYYSYPYGQLKDIGFYSIKNLMNVGYEAALSTIWSRSNNINNIYQLHRLEITPEDNLQTFIKKLESRLDLKYYKQLFKNFLYRARVWR